MTAKGGKSGWLKVTVLEGRALKDTGFVGLQSPYVIVKVGKDERRSKTHKSGGVSPQWNEELDAIHLKNIDEHPTLHVSVLNEAFLLKDDHIGATQIPLADVYEMGKVENSYSLRTTTDRLRGSISLIIRFTEDAPQLSFISQPSSVSEGVSLSTSPPNSELSSGALGHVLATPPPQVDSLYPPSGPPTRSPSFPMTDSVTTVSPSPEYASFAMAQVALPELVSSAPRPYPPSSQEAAYGAPTGPPLTRGGVGDSSSHRGLGLSAPGPHPSSSAAHPSYVSDPSRQSPHLPPSSGSVYPPTGGPMQSTTGPPPCAPVYRAPASQPAVVRQPSPPSYPPSTPAQSSAPHSSGAYPPPPAAAQSMTVPPSSAGGYPPAQPASSPITSQPHPVLHSSSPHSAASAAYYADGSRQERNQHISSGMAAVYGQAAVPPIASAPQLPPSSSSYPPQAYGYHPPPTGVSSMSSSSGVGASPAPQHCLSMSGSGYTTAVETYQGPIAGQSVVRSQTLPSHVTAGVQLISAPSLESLQISSPARSPSAGQQSSAREDSRSGSLGASRPTSVPSSSMVQSVSSSISGSKVQRAWNDTDDKEQVVERAPTPPPPPPAAVAEKVSSPKRQIGGSGAQFPTSGDPSAQRRHASPPQSVYGHTMSATNAESSQPYGAQSHVPVSSDAMASWRPGLSEPTAAYGGHAPLQARSAETVMGYPPQPTGTSSGRTAQPVSSSYGHVAQGPLADGSSPYPSLQAPTSSAPYGGHGIQGHPADAGMGYPPSVSMSDANAVRRHAQAPPSAYGQPMQTPPPDGHMSYAPVSSLTSSDPNATRHQAQPLPSSYGQQTLQGSRTDAHLSATHPTAVPHTAHAVPHNSGGACWNEYAQEPPHNPATLNAGPGSRNEYTPDPSYHVGSGGGGDQGFPPVINTGVDNRYAPMVAAASSYTHCATYSAPPGRYTPQDIPTSSPPVSSYGHVGEYTHAPARMDAPPIPVQPTYHSSTLSDVHGGGGAPQSLYPSDVHGGGGAPQSLSLYPPQRPDALDRGQPQPVHGTGRSSGSMTDAGQALQQQRYSMPSYQGYGTADGGTYAPAQSWDSQGNNPSYLPTQSHVPSSLGRSPSGGGSKSHSD